MELGLTVGLDPTGTKFGVLGRPGTNRITFKYGTYLAATGNGDEAFSNWPMLPRPTRAAVVALAQIALMEGDKGAAFAPEVAA
jgi:hypothetical protein